MFLEELNHSTHYRISVVFLQKLESYPSLPSDLTLYLGTLYKLSTTPNGEIRLRFYRVALSDPSSSAAKILAVDAVKWVIGDDGSGVVKGRMKFCRPVMKAVTKVDRNLAISNWEKAKMRFHPIARKLIEKVKLVEIIHHFVETYLSLTGYGNQSRRSSCRSVKKGVAFMYPVKYEPLDGEKPNFQIAQRVRGDDSDDGGVRIFDTVRSTRPP